MMIINTTKSESGCHVIESQSHRTSNWMGDEWIEVPENLVQTLYECGGYCDLTIEDGKLIDIIPTERPELELEPSALTFEERLFAVESVVLNIMESNTK